GLADLRTCSPLNHARYLNFMEAIEANLGYCNLMHLPAEISPLADLASLKLLVSNTPIHTAKFAANPKDFVATSIKEGRIMNGMRILGGHCDYSQSAAEINCHLNLRIHENLYGRYQAAVLLKDSDDTELWRSPLIVFGPSKTAAHESSIDMSIPAPHKSKNAVKVLLLIRDAWTGSDINADGLSLDMHDGKSVLASFALQPTNKVQTSDGRFKMIYESADLIRVYENVTALPNAFLVHHVKVASSEADALTMLKSASFNPLVEAIVEGKELSLNPKEQVKDSLLTLSTTNTEIQFESDSASDSVLVNTGLNYPGWKVFVDGKQEPLLQANYLFRGVKLASGHHLIRFFYEPMSFIAGCLTSLLCLLACLFVLIFKRKEGSSNLRT
ncbi:MAG: YfhO family protein, partial [Candidatus Obscuribacterales bacterium]|nr:YfhO family protein [Candidatus Obscuribacterales bacterium]